ncbi:MAG: class I SAM-dependent methyltransferase [Patescibacteria group bacterium]
MKNTLKNKLRNLKSVIPTPLWSFAKKCLYTLRPRTEKASGHYSILKNPNLAELKRKYEDIWKDSSIPAQQLKVNARSPKSAPVYEAAVKLIRATHLTKPTILEIGCSTGYYADVFKDAGLEVSYEGCDYSEAFVAKAKELHPGISFRTEDATKLGYPDTSFDIAISGCCILHIIDYEKAIAETARVATQYALFHRTPVVRSTSTTYAEKIGYGLPMFEIFFNESELFDLFKKYGLDVAASETISSMNVPGLGEPVLITSYLCKKS